MFRSLAACAAAWLLPLVVACAAPPPIEAFARLPAIRGVGISPNGRQLVYGTDQKVLMQNSPAAESQFQDRILDWTPGEPDSVLIELDADRTSYPSVYELNVYTGGRKLRNSEHQPIRDYSSDANGNIRLGYGYRSGTSQLEYFARLENEREWRRLLKLKAFEPTDALVPIAIAPGKNRAFAVGSYEGRSALWEIDLTDASEPQLLFSHPLVDAAEPLLTPGGRLLGIAYETDRPFIYYTDDAT